MASRPSLDEKLAAIRALRDEGPSAARADALKRGLGDKSNLIVAASATIVAASRLAELAADLETAFGRFLVNPLKDDKLCRAKIAIVQALDALEHSRPGIFHQAARHVQLEPVWGGQEDTAAPLRAAAIFALARIGDPLELPLLVDSLADPEKDVRLAAAQALVCFENEGGGLLLRLKARIGDGESEVLAECFTGLLAINPQLNLPFVTSYLTPEKAVQCEAAAVALGKSRLPEALDPLRSCWKRSISSSQREQILLAIAMLRHPAAMDFLLDLVASDSEKDAIAALFALKIHNYDARLCERIAAIVVVTGSHLLQARYDRDFRSAE